MRTFRDAKGEFELFLRTMSKNVIYKWWFSSQYASIYSQLWIMQDHKRDFLVPAKSKFLLRFHGFVGTNKILDGCGSGF